MRLIWKLPDNDGGERIKSYFIEKKCVTDKAWTKVNIAQSILFQFRNFLHFSFFTFSFLVLFFILENKVLLSLV